MKAKKSDGGEYVPEFTMKGIPNVKFGGFGLSRFMCTDKQKIPYWGKTLPEAMILAADQGKGSHLITAYEWAALAYLWQKAKKVDDLHFDLHAETWQWVMGLFMSGDGHVDVLASLDVSYHGSPYGRGTIKRNGKRRALVCNGAGSGWLKNWPPGKFSGMSVYIAEANNGDGGFYTLAGNKSNSLILDDANLESGKATFVVLKHIQTDVTQGLHSGEYVESLSRNNDLAPFAIPNKTSSNPNANFGNGRLWFQKSSHARAAIRGGDFNNTTGAGVFYLALNGAPSASSSNVGFRAAKAL